MSHTVTIQTRTVTSGNPSVFNTGFCRTWTGLLKIAQVILGAVTLALYWGATNYQWSHERNFFFTIVTTFFITTTIIVLSCCCSFTTEGILSKTTFELLYHALGFALLLVVSILILAKDQGGYYHSKYERPAAVAGFAVVALGVDALNEIRLYHDDIFLLLMATAFMMGTLIFIISYIFSPVSEAIISKTNYEIIYNGFASFFLLLTSLYVIAQDTYRKQGGQIVAGVFGIIDAVLYAVSLAFAIKNKI